MFSRENLISFFISLAIFLFFLILQRFIVKPLFRFVTRLTSRNATVEYHNIFSAFETPVRALLILTGIYLAILNLPIIATDNITVSRFFRSSIILVIAWGFYNLGDVSSGIFEEFNKKFGLQFNEVLVPFISKFIRIIIILLTISIIAQEWAYDIDGLIAGLGLGGLAFALAAQDTLANIFGGIVIILDKPFTIGDWISAPGGEGTVETISFRSTKLRTFAQSVITIPNSSLASQPITNWSRMGKRRVSFSLGVTYSTSQIQLKKCIDEIKALLINHPEIDKETILVTFDKFNDSSLDIFLYFFTKTTNWQTFHQVKQEVNFSLMEILEKHDVSIAFPSTSVYMETPVKQIHIVEKSLDNEMLE